MDTLNNERDALMGRKGSRFHDVHAVPNDETVMTTGTLQVKENSGLKARGWLDEKCETNTE
jgi:hypothetical protein